MILGSVRRSRGFCAWGQEHDRRLRVTEACLARLHEFLEVICLVEVKENLRMCRNVGAIDEVRR